MKIAVASGGRGADSVIPAHFSDAGWLLVFDMDGGGLCACIEKSADDPHNEAFARAVLQWDCESVLCGELEEAPFDLLAGRGVTRSHGGGLTVEDALAREQTLPLITKPIGGAGCPSHGAE